MATSLLKRWLALSATVLFVCAMPVNPGAAESENPAAVVVEGVHDALLSVMKEADALGLQGRFNRLSEPLGQAFDFFRMIRIASNPQWKSADENKRADLLSAFRRMSIATYAAQFKGYSGQRFDTVGTRPGPQGTTLVATRIVEEDGSDVGLTYVMIENEGRWMIADVLLDDTISQLAVRRSEYRRTLKTKGVDGLIKSLNDAADKLLTE